MRHAAQSYNDTLPDMLHELQSGFAQQRLQCGPFQFVRGLKDPDGCWRLPGGVLATAGQVDEIAAENLWAAPKVVVVTIQRAAD